MAFACFLVDVWCLGVKDVIINVAPRPRYETNMYQKLAQQGMVSLRPKCDRKLVEGSIQYALDLGLPPHPDYRVGKLIFGDIAVEACTEEYSYGKDGKPMFVAGPYRFSRAMPANLRRWKVPLARGEHFFIVPGGGARWSDALPR